MSNKHLVFCTVNIPGKSLEKLAGRVELKINTENEVISRSEFLDRSRDADGLITTITEQIDRELLEACPRLKVIANFAVGFDNVDIEAVKARSIALLNTPDVLTDSTADTAFALILTVAKRIVEADSFARSGSFTQWTPCLFVGSPVSGKRLGIIGFGKIGRALAKRAAGFNMDVVYYNKSVVDDRSTRAKMTGLDELLRTSDFISLHVPLNDSTRHLMGAEEFKRMKPGAIFINTSRGSVVEEKELINALNRGLISGAGLDVYEKEPAIPLELREMKNVVLLPHIGSADYETREKMMQLATEGLWQYLSGGKPKNRVV